MKTAALYVCRMFHCLYAFPKSVTNKVGLSEIDLFFSGKNLLTFTKWHGWDPEAGSTYSGRPVMRSFSFGVSLTY